ncbi:MAG: protein DpdE, partial [Gemmataceae bacterium]
MKRKPSAAFHVQVGWKVLRVGHERDGYGEIAGYPDKHDQIEVHYHTSPVRKLSVTAPIVELRRPAELPAQTRVYHRDGKVYRNGRILDREPKDDADHSKAYRVQFPNQDVRTLLETDFHVRSNLPTDDPVGTMIDLAHETPFFFENRSAFVREYVRQLREAGGMTGLLSARIELFPHQVEVVRRVLQDPEIRYLLADEVGLGKTIEAGVVLRQMRLDAPEARIGVFVPEPLVTQWRDELRDRLDLTGVDIFPHDHFQHHRLPAFDVVAIDEAHKLVAAKKAPIAQRRLFEKVRQVCHKTKHLLLLSATPVLNHEAELLALLHLLSPEAYRLEDLDSFRKRVELRRELGRTLLALPAAKSGLALRQHLRRLIDLLPSDPEVKNVAPSLAPDANAPPEELRAAADALQVHLTETYRLHRRMLRTRRSLLVEQGLVPAERVPYPPVVENDPRLPDLWAEFDNWRSAVAAYVSENPTERPTFVDAYLDLALLLATDVDLFREKVEERTKELKRDDLEQPLLKRLLAALKKPGPAGGRLDLVRRFLDKLAFEEKHLDRRKYIVFCNDRTVCDWIVQNCNQKSRSLGAVAAHAGMTREQRHVSIERFRRNPNCHVLIVDPAMEEGQNFQFAYRLIMFDLPFSPMRLEQRIGRLDRLNRLDNIHIHVILTNADPNLALDAAWHAVLADGLGIYQRSFADLQLLLDRELGTLRDAAFDGGPAALLREVPRLSAAVAKERQEAAEQDAIDGLYLGDLNAAPAYVHLREADKAAAPFGEAMNDYWRKTMRLGVHKLQDRPGVVRYGRQDRVPLIPFDRFQTFEAIVNQPATVFRDVAVTNPDVQLLRPGHAFVAALRGLADWDDRGRAFVMWRQAPGLVEPRFVFRVCVLTGLELPRLLEPLRKAGYDELSQASLLRLVSAWFPPRYDEIFLDERGETADAELADFCTDEYARDDMNLDAEKSPVILELLGSRKWPGICRKVRDEALERVPKLPEFVAGQQAAVRSARDHFQMVQSRLQ